MVVQLARQSLLDVAFECTLNDNAIVRAGMQVCAAMQYPWKQSGMMLGRW